jgi:hypothetical protein
MIAVIYDDRYKYTHTHTDTHNGNIERTVSTIFDKKITQYF